MKFRLGEDVNKNHIKLRVRLDYKGETKPGRFFFGGKSTEKVAEDTREQRIALLRNIPMQGIVVEDIDTTMEIYTAPDETTGEDIAYAPAVLTVCADTLEDVLRLVMREEFRRVEVMEPDQLTLSRYEIERLLFKVSDEFGQARQLWERRLNSK